MRLRVLVLVPALLLLGCDEKSLVIESDTAWTGSINHLGPVSGEGSGEFDLSDFPSDVCWQLRKTSSAGTLRAYLRDETWFGLGKEIDGDQTTTAPSGEVRGCNQ
jgi:hypothetical protein